MFSIYCLLAVITNITDFSCSFASLSDNLPRLKLILRPDEYQSLEKLHKKYSAKGELRDSKIIGQEISRALSDDSSRLKCFAALSISYGYFSITDNRITAYLEIDETISNKIRTINKELLESSKRKLEKYNVDIRENEFASVHKSLSIKYGSTKLTINNMLGEKKTALLDIIYQGYDHDAAIKRVIYRQINDRLKLKLQSTAYIKYHPNIQIYFKSGGLLLMDCKHATDYLQLSIEQTARLKDIFESYSKAVSEVQESLSSSLGNSAEEAIQFHREVAEKIAKKYEDMFLNLLNNSQRKRLDSLMAQILGYKVCFMPKYKNAIGFTDEQDRKSLKYISKLILQFPEDMTDSDIDYEKLYRLELFVSDTFISDILNESQRKKLNDICAVKLQADALSVVRKLYFRRTSHWILAPSK